MTPKVEELLIDWNARRLELAEVQEEICNLQARVDHLRDRMKMIPCQIEDLFGYELDQPVGLKIGDDYIVVVQNPDDCNFSIQTVDFKL